VDKTKRARGKAAYNALAREIAFAGPILCRPKKFVNAFKAGNSISYDRLCDREVMILVRGPLPAGEHGSTSGGGCWLMITSKGVRYFFNNFKTFDELFKKIV
jgi:hypothetical protein